MGKMILAFLITALFAGVGTVEAVTFPGTKTQAVLAQPDGSSPYFAWGTLGIEIGKKHDSDKQMTETARTKYAFDLRNIPGNATITGVSLGYAVGNGPNGNYDFYITSIPDYSDPSTIFQGIPISTPVFSMVTYGSGSLSSSDLTSLVNSKKGGYMYLGAYSDGESYSDSYANMNLTLFVTYTVNLIADNNFTVTGGSHGSIKVDGNTFTAPYPFSRYTGTNVTLQAVSPQTDYQGYQQVWNTSSCDQSRWTRNYSFKSWDQSFSFAVSSSDNNATYLANFHQNRVTTSGTMTANENWVSTVTLAGNITVPSGITLAITSCATVNLLNGSSRYSIISTGGTIAIETGATINGLAAKLMYGSQLKGLCGKVQTAIDNCAYPYSVHIQSGNFNELVTIINKPNIIVGGEYGTLVNGISIYNSDGAEVDVLATYHLFLSGCTLPYLQEILVVPYSEEAEGSFFAYNNSYMNLRGITLSNTPYGYGACFSNTTGASYPPGWGYGLDFANNECATVFYSGSSFTLHQPHFCSNGTDISTDPSSSVTCVDGPTFSGDPHQTTYGNVGWTSYSICGQLSRSAPPSRSSAFVGDTIMDKFQSLNAFYHEISGKTFSDKGDRSHAFARFSDQCKSFISSNTKSPFAKTVLNLAVHAYRQMKDYEGLESFLSEVMARRDMKSLQGRAKRHLIDCYAFKKDYDTALKIAQEILNGYSADTNLVCDVLFAKGLLYEFSLNRTDEARLMYKSIAGSYPRNWFAKMARERMAILSNGSEPPQKNANASEASTQLVAGNYPNPFNPITIISYTVPHDQKVVLKVYDVLGREVRQLVDEYKTAGRYSVTFDGSDLASGVYFYRIEAGKLHMVGKLLLMK